MAYVPAMRHLGGSLVTVVMALGALAAPLSLSIATAEAEPAERVAARRATTLTNSPKYPLAGTPVKLRAQVPTKGQRPIQLQRLVGSTWTKIAGKLTTTTGVATFTITTPGRAMVYRAWAPRVANKGLAAVATPRVTLNPTFPPIPGTSQQTGLGEYPVVTATGTHVAYTGSTDDSTFAARLHTVSGHADAVAGEPATGATISGDGTTMLFRKGGQGFWDPSWGLVRRVDGVDTTVWQESVDGEFPWVEHTPGGVSADGRFASFTAVDSADEDGRVGLYLLDGTTYTRIAWTSSVESDIAPDGSCVGFDTFAKLVPEDDDTKLDAYIWVRATNKVHLVQRSATGNGASYGSARPSMSAGCRYVAWEQQAAYSSWQVWVWDRETNQRRMVSHAYDGKSYGDNTHASISSSGAFIAFESTASLTSDKDSGNYDIYLWNKSNGGITLLTPTAGTIGAGLHPEISDDGRHVTFDGAPKSCESPCDRRVYLWSRTS